MFSLIFSLVFLALLEGAVFLSGGYFGLAALGVLVFSLYIVWRAVPVKKPAFLVLAVFSALPAILFLTVSQNLIFSQIAVLISSAIFYALASGYSGRNPDVAMPFDSSAEVLTKAEALRGGGVALISFIEFFAIVFLALVYQTMAAVSGWVTGPIIFAAASLLFFSSIYLVLDLRGALLIRLLLFSFLAGFAVTEFYFALSLLPFNLPSIDFLVFIIYYGLWDISSRYFSERLTKKALLIDIALVIFSYAAIFLSAKWFPN
ncbi:MAG TPA: hypothetical protein VJK01_00445 [Candidatus Paceibacterota bacterium]